MFAALAIFYSYLVASYAVDPKFKDCGSKTGELNSITVTGCEQNPCTFKVGQDAQITAEFTSKTSSKVANVKIQGILAGIPFPFPLSPEDACGNYGVKCPLNNGDKNTLSLKVPVKKEYPPVSVKVRFQLIDSSNQDLFCVEFPVKIEH
ncbi:hypothetical protein B4U80_09544 [Leptotrombidium deliense]|uniref:MD-2-related lipid-recognition domain-containing protein n=1 Tax=Leptotrombidium deliense TaxID=299467 RepID=A0A443SKA3_9ACAR|nr:hypothetical protein B4U80_09544 [Leptotrombidium deliense]